MSESALSILNENTKISVKTSVDTVSTILLIQDLSRGLTESGPDFGQNGAISGSGFGQKGA